MSASGGETHPVGQLKPNAWGLYDMYSNVWEWVPDRYGTYAPAVADAPVVDPTGPSMGVNRVLCGGSWFDDGGDVRSALRFALDPGRRGSGIGCRLVQGQASSR